MSIGSDTELRDAAHAGRVYGDGDDECAIQLLSYDIGWKHLAHCRLALEGSSAIYAGAYARRKRTTIGADTVERAMAPVRLLSWGVMELEGRRLTMFDLVEAMCAQLAVLERSGVLARVAVVLIEQQQVDCGKLVAIATAVHAYVLGAANAAGRAPPIVRTCSANGYFATVRAIVDVCGVPHTPPTLNARGAVVYGSKKRMAEEFALWVARRWAPTLGWRASPDVPDHADPWWSWFDALEGKGDDVADALVQAVVFLVRSSAMNQ